jgi:hypothetical protein
MCRPIKRPGDERVGVDDLEDLFATRAPSIDDLSSDPEVRLRIGEWISLAMNRATLRRRRRRRDQGHPVDV